LLDRISMLLIFLQFSILTIVSLGWMYWLNHWLAHGTWSWPRSVVLFGAGFAVQVLILQNFTYIDLPVDKAFYVPTLIGLGGAWRLLEAWRKEELFDRIFRGNTRVGGGIFIGVFLLQSVSGILQGPENYYGKAHIDQLNYTLVSEFLRTEAYSMPETEMLTHPWMIRVASYKHYRIGQSIAQGYVASLTFVSSKEAYAALCGFLVALSALSMFTLARSFSFPSVYCILSAVWVGLAPAITKMHLDGFLSQTAVQFVFPLVVVWGRLTYEDIRFKVVSGAILFSYLLVTYTELFVIGLFLLGLLTIAMTISWSHRQLAISTAVGVMSVFFVPAYVPKAIQFVSMQYASASSRNAALEVLAVDGGTIYGWARGLIEIPIVTGPIERQLTTLAGVLMLALCLIGLYTLSRRRQLLLSAVTLTPVVFLGILLTAQELAKYPFAKICDSFTFVWVLLMMRGISLLAMFIRRKWGSWAPEAFHAVPGSLLLLAVCGFAVQHRMVATQHSAVTLVSSKTFKDSLAYIKAHPERIYVVNHTDGLAVGWLAYEGRFSKVFLRSPRLSDIELGPSLQAYMKPPSHVDSNLLTSVTADGYKDITRDGGAVDMAFSNPQGQDGGGSAMWFWLGDKMMVELFRWHSGAPQEYILTFGADAGPANLSPDRVLRVTNLGTGHEQPIRFTHSGKFSVPLVLVPGENRVQIESVTPVEHTVRNPNDPRKHMSRLHSFILSSPKQLQAGDPRAVQTSAGKSPPLPLLTPRNPQNEDRAGDTVWYWIGKQMEVEVSREDGSSKDFVYELSFDAQAGPANPDPKRKVRIRTATDKIGTEVSFSGEDHPKAIFTAQPGTTRVLIEVLSPTEQVVRVPNDPRIHMVRASNFKVKLIRGDVPTPAPPPKKTSKQPVLAGQ